MIENLKLENFVYHKTSNFELVGRVLEIIKEDKTTRLRCKVVKDMNGQWELENFSFTPRNDNCRIITKEEHPEYYL